VKGFTKDDLLNSKAGQRPENKAAIVGENFPQVKMQQGSATFMPNVAVKKEPSNIIQNLVMNLTVQKSTDEQKLNKLETAWLAEMRRRNYEWIGVQNITLKLADDLRYTPDFSAKVGGDLVFFETKGFFRDDARGKLKTAARQFPLFRFVLVTKEKMQWTETPVKP
jgi:hypothetical protein